MLMSFRFLPALAGAVLLACPQAFAAEPVGEIERVVLYAYGTLPSDQRKPAYTFDKVYFGEKLETVDKGSMKVSFVDHTALFLGSKSQLTIDSFVYDPKAGQESLSLRMGTGAFRFVTGKIAKSAVSVQTPVADIGIRGTDFSIGVTDDGKSVIAVDSGTVAISTTASKEPTIANAGDVVTVNADGSVSVGTANAAPNDIGLSNAGSTDGVANGSGDGPSGGSGDSGGDH